MGVSLRFLSVGLLSGGRERLDRPVAGRPGLVRPQRLDADVRGAGGEVRVDALADLRLGAPGDHCVQEALVRSEEHTSELQSLMRISYAVFCLKKKTEQQVTIHNHTTTE